MIAPSIAPQTIVEGYEIHMSGKKFDDETIQYLKDLAITNGLFIDSKERAVGIYKVKKGIFK